MLFFENHKISYPKDFISVQMLTLATGEPRCVLIPYGRPKKSAQIRLLQHFSEVVLVLLALFSK